MKTRRLLLLCSLLGCAVFSGCEEPPSKQPVRPVKAMKVGDTAGLSGRWFPGRAAATEEVNLSFRVSGPLVDFPADEVGKEVAKGEILARVDPRDYEVALRSAEAGLARSQAELEAMKKARPEEIAQLKAAVDRAQAENVRARNEYKRLAQLVQQKVVTKTEFDRGRQLFARSDAELRAAQEALRIGERGARKEDILAKQAEIESLLAARDAARDRLGYTSLKAPFGGSVAATFVDNFQTVQAKQPILRLLDTSKIEITVNIPETSIAYAPYAKDLVCIFDSLPGREIPATIKEIGTEASQTTRTYPVKLIMDQPKDIKILPGMAGRVRGRVELPEEVGRRGVEVPVGAIFTPETEKQSYVWVIDLKSQTVTRRAVTVGKLTKTGVLVREGLEREEWIVIAGVHSLEEGRKVDILKASGT